MEPLTFSVPPGQVKSATDYSGYVAALDNGRNVLDLLWEPSNLSGRSQEHQ